MCVEWLRRHWLWSVNLLAAVFVGLPVLAPLLMAAGRPDLANPIYAAYRLVCHQWAFRSYFLLGEGTVYPILSRFKREGLVTTTLVESNEGPARKYYELTPAGRRELARMRGNWRAVRDGIDSLSPEDES